MILFGAMNNPSKDSVEEVKLIAQQKFDYCDFTYEANARISLETVRKIREVVGYINSDFRFVGHTAYYLPITTDFDEVVDGSISAMKKSIDRMLSFGIKKVTIHHDPGTFFMYPDFRIDRHIYVLNQLLATYDACDLQIMLENSPFGGSQNNEIAKILAGTNYKVGLHLDIAHALITGGMDEVKAFLRLGDSHRLLKHIHISDNNGKNDDHLPIGIPHKVQHDWKKIIELIRETGYGSLGHKDTITLEVFAPDREQRVRSRNIIRELWENA